MMTVCRTELEEKVAAHKRQLQDNIKTQRDGWQYGSKYRDQMSDVDKILNLRLIDDMLEAVDKEHEYL